ncbi:hypothetical protein Mgra_00003193 [Meloidogyne graminicola]|uniref:F-box domain-containing protein n=1 Tax=Meloidogyne graminicola TaxID=189291 RepID=A0A8S9ZW07_9BILA|nr:hypothetical protein Mgra_00003193 [Meloidogyne graminicola]
MAIELIKPDIEQLIPELLAALRPKICKLVSSPDLTLLPFFLKTANFGEQIYIVSDSFSIEEAKKQISIETGQLIATKNNFHIFTDGQPSNEIIYLFLNDIIEWKIPLKLILNKLIENNNWEIIYAEKYFFENKIKGNFGILKGKKEEEEEENKDKDKKQIEIWLTFFYVNREQTPSSQTTTTSSEEIINENKKSNICNGKNEEDILNYLNNSNEQNKNNLLINNHNNGILLNQKFENQKSQEQHQQPLYLKIPVQTSISPPKENEILSKLQNGNNYNESSPSRSIVDSDSPNSLSYVSAHNDFISSSNRRSWRREDAPSPSTSLILQNTRRNISSSISSSTNQIINGHPIHRLVTPLGSNLSPISSCGSVEGQQDFDKDILNNKKNNTISCTYNRNYSDDDDDIDDDEDESTLMLLSKERIDEGDELTIMSSIREDLSLRDSIKNNLNGKIREKHGKINGGGKGGIIGCGGGGHSSISPPPRHSSFLCRSIGGSRGALSRSPSTVASNNLQMVRGMLGIFRMPVTVLQQILGLFSFKEIGLLRRVHPHWDELAGQLLNAAHFKLIQKAQHLLTNCQRRSIKEPRMGQPVKLLTRLHVHALNPIDGMRAFMDEGVLCFPYGSFLDQSFNLLAKIDEMINNFIDEEKQEYQFNEANNLMEKLAEITRKAVIHYRQWVEPEAEKRMSELYRVSAQQRLQRIDSFLVESSVNRVEREAERNRNEINWEMEQLKQQNIQLKKENRELKQLCQRLDQRIEIIERKFKTMAKLCQ